ncbi:MAG: class I SAM-dependent methyltransferase [Ktedonobacterales bacterium]
MRARDAEIRELLDAQVFDSAALQRNMRDIRRINALLGWTSFTVRALSRYVRTQRCTSFSLLDVASGSADMPLAIARWARRNGIDARIVATDVNPEIVAVAREQAAALPEVRVELQDALALSYAAGSFDIALCTLALHHFDPEPAVTLLRNLARVGRRVLVFDVVRSPVAYAGAVLLTRAASMDGMTRHDAPASVRRAYTAPELETLAARAGLRNARVRVGFPFRLALDALGDT